MAFGRKVPRGHLPVYAVADEDEAQALLVLACPRDPSGAFVARELVHAQTLDNLAAFSARLDAAHDLLVRAGRCRCAPQAPTKRVEKR